VPWQPKGRPCPGCTKPSIARRSGQGIVPLRTALVRPHRQHWVQLWGPQDTKGIELWERVQGRAARMGKGLEGRTREERLRSLGWFSLEKRRLRGDPIAVCTFLKGGTGGRC